MSAPRIEVESDHSLPLVHFQLLFPGGALTDPPGSEGLARLSARWMRRGTQRRDAGAVETAIDSLGGELGIETGFGFVRISGSVIRSSVEPLLALIGEMVRTPALTERDFAQLRRETLAALTEALDNDAALAGTQFRRLVFGDHPYARSVAGNRKSVAACTPQAARAYHARWIATGPSLVGFAGDVSEEEATRWTETHLGPGTEHDFLTPPEPAARTGRTVCMVDKPARTQTQLYIGCLGTSARDEDHHALIVGNAVFGGTFTSRLMREVRSERGWSYGASSRLSVDRVRDCWSMWTHPAVEDAADCAQLQVELMERWVGEGVSDEEVAFAKSFLIKSHAFNVDTAEKRLDQRIEAAVLALPDDYHAHYLRRLSEVEPSVVNIALQRRLDPSRLCLSILATAESIEARMRDHLRFDLFEHKAYDQDA